MSVITLIARIFVGALFVVHGAAFAALPPKVRERMEQKRLEQGGSPLTEGQFRILGAAELAGGLALLILPAIDVAVPLAYAAAGGIAIVLIVATILHVRERERASTAFTLVSLAMTALAVVGL